MHRPYMDSGFITGKGSTKGGSQPPFFFGMQVAHGLFSW